MDRSRSRSCRRSRSRSPRRRSPARISSSSNRRRSRSPSRGHGRSRVRSRSRSRSHSRGRRGGRHHRRSPSGGRSTRRSSSRSRRRSPSDSRGRRRVSSDGSDSPRSRRSRSPRSVGRRGRSASRDGSRSLRYRRSPSARRHARERSRGRSSSSSSRSRPRRYEEDDALSSNPSDHSPRERSVAHTESKPSTRASDARSSAPALQKDQKRSSSEREPVQAQRPPVVGKQSPKASPRSEEKAKVVSSHSYTHIHDRRQQQSEIHAPSASPPGVRTLTPPKRPTSSHVLEQAPSGSPYGGVSHHDSTKPVRGHVNPVLEKKREACRESHRAFLKSSSEYNRAEMKYISLEAELKLAECWLTTMTQNLEDVGKRIEVHDWNFQRATEQPKEA